MCLYVISNLNYDTLLNCIFNKSVFDDVVQKYVPILLISIFKPFTSFFLNQTFILYFNSSLFYQTSIKLQKDKY